MTIRVVAGGLLNAYRDQLRMKKMMIMGGMLGFVIGAVTGLVKDVSWPALFLRSCVVALISGLLFRWWGQVMLNGLKDSLAVKAAEKQAGQTTAAK